MVGLRFGLSPENPLGLTRLIPSDTTSTWCSFRHLNRGEIGLGSENSGVLGVEIAFRTKRLRDMCASEVEAEGYLGAAVANELKRRIADLRAATAISDLIASPPIPIGDSDQLAMPLSDGHRIIIAANHLENPKSADGGIDWSAVQRVRLMDIVK
jgi:toxin HigB-1